MVTNTLQVVDGGGADLQDDLAGARDGVLDGFHLEDFGAAVLADADGLHGRGLYCRPVPQPDPQLLLERHGASIRAVIRFIRSRKRFS